MLMSIVAFVLVLVGQEVGLACFPSQSLAVACSSAPLPPSASVLSALHLLPDTASPSALRPPLSASAAPPLISTPGCGLVWSSEAERVA